jgi:hypothetical protein
LSQDGGDVARWPDVALALWAELERNPGRFALLCGPDANKVAGDLADLRGTVPVHVGRRLTAFDSKPSESTVRATLTGHSVLTGTEVLFDPVLGLEPVRLLTSLAKASPPVVATWPVETGTSQLEYPPGVAPGRDLAQDLQGCLLLTTQSTLFADEAPFTAERFH